MRLPELQRSIRVAACAFAVAVALVAPSMASAASAQQGLPPGMSPEQARELLRNRPDLAAQLRDRIGASGLTPDQVRARLRAAGYPEDILDPYLAGADTTDSVEPPPGTLDAIRALGILGDAEVDSLELIDSLRLTASADQRLADSIRLARADELRSDSLADSLASRGRLKLFGIEVFRRTSTRFQPAAAGPVDDSYRLGPGDMLVLILTGDVESTRTLEVTRDGFVLIPQVGQVYVANQTLGQVRNQLYTRLGRIYSGISRSPNATTRFDLTVAKLRNIQVFVVGDVVRPGSYQISGAGTALTALYAAGGPTESGSFRNVTIRRAGAVVDTFDIYDYLLRGDNTSDVALQTGDVIFVPVHGGFVKAAGEVERPAIYELRSEETLTDLLAFAGGFSEVAYRARVQINRILPAESRGPGGRARVVVDVGADAFAGGTIPAVPLVPGDSVTAFALSDAVSSFVTVAGNVWVEGPVGFTPGMTLSEAIRLAGGARPGVYLDRILITRTNPDSTRVQLRSAFADTTGNVVSDLTLQDQDRIEIFSRTAFQPDVYVTITGAVETHGRIPFREGMTLRDAVLVAGGLDEGADLREAEIARIAGRTESGALAETIRVPLDSTYLFDRYAGAPYQGAPGYPAPASGAPEAELRPYDNVVIFRQPGWDIQRLVYLTGQVRHPGRYALTSKTERLSDLVERAGGLTDEAYAGGIEFYRVTQFQRQRDARAAERERRARVDGDPASTVDDLPLREEPPMGYRDRVGVDLVRALRDEDSIENLILAGGDSINVPEYESVVMVGGAVNAPGPVAFEEGKNIDWYVRRAGGYAARSDDKLAYVTQPNGEKDVVKRRFLADRVPRVGAGAVVFVPERDLGVPREASNVAQILSTVVGAVATLVTTIVLVSRQ